MHPKVVVTCKLLPYEQSSFLRTIDQKDQRVPSAS